MTTDTAARADLRPLLDIALFAAIVVADGYGLVPITQTVFLLPLIGVVMRIRGEGRAVIGLTRPRRLARAVGLGALAGVALEALAVLVTTPALAALFGVEPDYSGFAEIRGNLPLLLLFVALSWVLAAFGEEICFRGFLMQRIARLLGGTRGAWIAGLVLSSAMFGWGHTEQGITGWFQEGLSGLLLGILFLLAKRNLAIPIVAHGVSNTVAFVLIYLGRYPGLG